MIFISEIGMNHNGNFDLCYELIKQSKNAGADIVKFQIGWRDGREDINYLDEKRFQQITLIVLLFAGLNLVRKAIFFN